MPRLVGKRSDGGLVPGLVLLVLMGAAGYLEYAGVIDLIPGVGQEPGYILDTNEQPRIDTNEQPSELPPAQPVQPQQPQAQPQQNQQVQPQPPQAQP